VLELASLKYTKRKNRKNELTIKLTCNSDSLARALVALSHALIYRAQEADA
jgi:hypothetical protein